MLRYIEIDIISWNIHIYIYIIYKYTFTYQWKVDLNWCLASAKHIGYSIQSQYIYIYTNYIWVLKTGLKLPYYIPTFGMHGHYRSGV